MDKDKAEKKEFTLDDLKELVVSIVDSHVQSKGLVKLKDLKESVHAELDNYVEPKLKDGFDELVEKLDNLPGEKGAADVGKGGDNVLKGLNGTGYYDNYAFFAKDVYLAGKAGCEPSPTFTKWMKDVRAYKDTLKSGKAAGSGMELGDPELGGYLVPPTWSTSLLEKGMENSNFINMTSKIPMQKNQVRIPFIKDFDHSSYLHGAMMAYWLDELDEKTSSKPKLGRISLDLNKLVVMCFASDELLEDSPVSIGPLLTTKAEETIGWKLDEALFRGTGAGQPRGVLSAPATVQVSKETGQAAATIVYQNLAKMYSRLFPKSHGSAVWVANLQIFPELMGLTIPVGTGGAAAYLPANGFSGKPYDTLLGKRIFWTEHASELGTAGDLMLVDWKEYLVGLKSGRGAGVQFATSIHLKFDYDQTAFRYVFRVDGQPWWPSAFTPKRGSTQSPFVKLQTRS